MFCYFFIFFILMIFLFFFFFFQAEDGIRDLTVTGVQTCALPISHLAWQPSELEELLGPLAERIRLEGRSNLRAPIALDARDHPWQVAPVDAVFTANTLHIMAWSAVREFVRGVGR